MVVITVNVQGSQRDSLDKIRSKNCEVPGPGYYNAHSDFDLPDSAGGGSSYNDTDFLMQLNAARKRQSAVFESRTQRDAMLGSIDKRSQEPGPGAYNLPSDIRLVSKPPDKQFFGSSGARFQDVSDTCIFFVAIVCHMVMSFAAHTAVHAHQLRPSGHNSVFRL